MDTPETSTKTYTKTSTVKMTRTLNPVHEKRHNLFKKIRKAWKGANAMSVEIKLNQIRKFLPGGWRVSSYKLSGMPRLLIWDDGDKSYNINSYSGR